MDISDSKISELCWMVYDIAKKEGNNLLTYQVKYAKENRLPFPIDSFLKKLDSQDKQQKPIKRGVIKVGNGRKKLKNKKASSSTTKVTKQVKELKEDIKILQKAVENIKKTNNANIDRHTKVITNKQSVAVSKSVTNSHSQSLNNYRFVLYNNIVGTLEVFDTIDASSPVYSRKIPRYVDSENKFSVILAGTNRIIFDHPFKLSDIHFHSWVDSADIRNTDGTKIVKSSDTAYKLLVNSEVGDNIQFRDKNDGNIYSYKVCIKRTV